MNYEPAPPSDLEAESAYLAALYRAAGAGDRAATTRLLATVNEQDYFLEDNVTLHKIFASTITAGRPLDALTILDAIGDDRMVKQSLTEAAKQTLASGFDYSHGDAYAAIIHRLSVQRQAIRTLNTALARMYGQFSAEAPPHAVLSDVSTDLSRLARGGTVGNFYTLKALTDEAIARKRECPTGNLLLTGVPTIDAWRMLNTHSTIVIAARPSMGKSTICRWLLSLLAAQGHRCGLVAVEEPNAKIAVNYLSAFSGIENQRLRSDNLCEQEWDAVNTAKANTDKLPIIINDACQTAEEVAAAIDTLVSEYGCAVVATDHLQRLWLGRRTENRNQEITRISSTLSNLHKRLGVCGILASQLNRPEQKHGCPPPPQMSNLRESGSIEQDADIVMMLHRPDYYRKAEKDYRPNHRVKVIIEKNRDGQTGFFQLIEELQYQRFREMTIVEEQTAMYEPQVPVPEFAL